MQVAGQAGHRGAQLERNVEHGIARGSDEIPLASFQPGDYRVLIQVEDKDSGKVVESRVRFTLKP